MRIGTFAQAMSTHAHRSGAVYGSMQQKFRAESQSRCALERILGMETGGTGPCKSCFASCVGLSQTCGVSGLSSWLPHSHVHHGGHRLMHVMRAAATPTLLYDVWFISLHAWGADPAKLRTVLARPHMGCSQLPKATVDMRSDFEL